GETRNSSTSSTGAAISSFSTRTRRSPRARAPTRWRNGCSPRVSRLSASLTAKRRRVRRRMGTVKSRHLTVMSANRAPNPTAPRRSRICAIILYLAAELRAEVSGMSLDNFIVRPQRRYVEKYSTGEAWGKVDADARHELIEHVAGLPSAVVDDDIAAKQFD